MVGLDDLKGPFQPKGFYEKAVLLRIGFWFSEGFFYVGTVPENGELPASVKSPEGLLREFLLDRGFCLD